MLFADFESKLWSEVLVFQGYKNRAEVPEQIVEFSWRVSGAARSEAWIADFLNQLGDTFRKFGARKLIREAASHADRQEIARRQREGTVQDGDACAMCGGDGWISYPSFLREASGHGCIELVSAPCRCKGGHAPWQIDADWRRGRLGGETLTAFCRRTARETLHRLDRDGCRAQDTLVYSSAWPDDEFRTGTLTLADIDRVAPEDPVDGEDLNERLRALVARIRPEKRDRPDFIKPVDEDDEEVPF